MRETIENALALRETETVAEPLMGHYPSYSAMPGATDDVVDPRAQTLVPGLPTFAARMRGVSDLK